MATPQSLIHGISRPRDVFAVLALTGLVFLHIWELPRLAAAHGGFAFVAAWLFCFSLLGVPMILLQLMLGRRSRRSPIEGMAFLTREADVPRFWRASAWGSALLSLLAIAAVALLAGGSISFLLRDLHVVDGAVQAVSDAGVVLPLGAGALFVFAAGLNLLPPAQRSLLVSVGIMLVLLLLLLAAISGMTTAGSLYQARQMSPDDWREALRLALRGMGIGMGVIWIAGMHLPRETALGKFGLAALFAHIVLAILLLLALAPFVAALQANAASETLQIVPSGALVRILMPAVVLASLLMLMLLAEPLLLWLQEKQWQRLPAVVLVYGLAAFVAETIWVLGGAAALQNLLLVLGILVLLVLLAFSLFAGWAMKISHARKELELSSEGAYNLWRVVVRLALPLAIFWVLAGYVA